MVQTQESLCMQHQGLWLDSGGPGEPDESNILLTIWFDRVTEVECSLLFMVWTDCGTLSVVQSFWQWPHWDWIWSRICSQTSWSTEKRSAGSRAHSWSSDAAIRPSAALYADTDSSRFCFSDHQCSRGLMGCHSSLVTVAMLDNSISTSGC